jgi:hypothetical protein
MPELRLTYAQIGARLGISADAARMLARRRGWTRQAPNRRGAPVFVVVQEDTLAAEHWRTEEERTSLNASANRADRPEEHAQLAERQAEERVLLAERRAEQAEQRADVAVALADRTLAELASANARLDQALDRAAEAMTKAERLREERDQAETRAQAAQVQADALRQAEADRRGQGRWARIRLAWRGL